MEINIKEITEKIPEIQMIIQFGSSISGDYVKNISDIDLAVIASSKEKQIRDRLFKEISQFQHQTHVFSMPKFIQALKKGAPLQLSILHTGKAVYGKKQFRQLKNKKFTANTETERKCMLNSFSALGLAISELTNCMLIDATNYAYHAARSSIWATLMKKEITPNSRKTLKLMSDKKIAEKYRQIIKFRKNIPDYDNNLQFSKELYQQGNFNKFTETINNAMQIIKTNYQIIFKKNFLDFFELLALLRTKYPIPDFYSIHFGINWKNESPYCLAMLHIKKKMRMLEINAETGQIREIK